MYQALPQEPVCFVSHTLVACVFCLAQFKKSNFLLTPAQLASQRLALHHDIHLWLRCVRCTLLPPLMPCSETEAGTRRFILKANAFFDWQVGRESAECTTFAGSCLASWGA
eukprot:scaffold53224_cov18-Tisochrysis_lutea.AAC.1